MVAKPERLFARDTEWRELGEFAGSGQEGASLGLVYGRRRQGKTLMLELLAREAGGFLFAATQQSEAQNLADLGAAYAAFRGLRRPVLFGDWREALEELLRIGENAAVPVVIDEFPYLVAATPALPSYLQQALSPLSHAKEHTRTRLILCGSALTTMAQLLGGGAPLRGRASMELVVRPFRFREAAAFWGVEADPELAFRLHALVGGTPAYKEMCGGAGPQSLADFDGWVSRRLLNPASAMFREGGLLLREEPSIADPTSYAAALTAVSAGHHRRSQIAGALGRPSSALAHLLSGLQDIGLLEQVEDALRDKRSVFRVAEPVVRLHQLLIQRHEPELVVGRADRVWAENADTVAGKIYGPHFEELARQWCFEHAAPESLGGRASWVRPTEIPCREHRRGHELDLVVAESPAFGTERITAIGEAKGTLTPVGVSQLERLEHLRGLLPSARVGALPKLLFFARSGFTDDLQRVADGRSDVELIDLHRMYDGE
ncbi:AAA family ATPase [Streptantibioticus ferralitis]|uniref:ATP-binding protein n=1 Tax=Streptantibioticus ferralitis TaxID=236510 RepID=A0ABT5ZCN3_9ACTN|nr:ATP-binding protein [Streptantibioticus ferralitis]MDF2261611.1 ATP-binding protein [Streptantibioticus ferralitis]